MTNNSSNRKQTENKSVSSNMNPNALNLIRRISALRNVLANPPKYAKGGDLDWMQEEIVEKSKELGIILSDEYRAEFPPEEKGGDN